METFLIRALQLIMSLSLLVIIHEGGHFLFSRLFKVRVEKFYIFFDPWFSLFKFKPKNSDTEYGIGFKVEDVNHGELGEIVAVDDSTMNVLFAIEKDGEELLLPAHEEFIIKLDKKKRLLTVEVPDGLI